MKTNEMFKKFTLLRNEMKMILGGGKYRCECEGSVGRWEGNYNSQADAVADGGQWCSSGVANCVELASVDPA